MERKDVVETVPWQLEIFWLLQELDEICRQKDQQATQLLDSIYSKRNAGWQEWCPFVRLKTTLTLWFTPICYANKVSKNLTDKGFCIKPCHSVTFRRSNKDENPDPKKVLRVLRNGLAHLPDFIASEETTNPNIVFDEGILKIRSLSDEVVFQTEKGFVTFLNDLLPPLKKVLRDDLHK